jgi:hypothetical protein
MMHKKFWLSFGKRSRRRPRHADDPTVVFKTFVHVLALMQAHARESPVETSAPEKGA